jgi:predicted nucleic acid-binding protein
VIYCDTSFLLPLYVARDVFHQAASAQAAQLVDGIPYTLLGELELINGLRRLLAGKIITPAEYDRAFRQIDEDVRDGILRHASLHQGEHFQKARELSKKFTPALQARSLDILHVAAALLLEARHFYSFDAKQRLLAEQAKLTLNKLPLA